MNKFKQHGFTLISTVIGMAMLSVVGVVIYKEGTQFLLERKVDKLYDGYHGLDDALDHYVKQNWRSLIGNKPIPGIAAVWAPTIPELVKQGYLDTFVPTKFLDAGQLSYVITVTPAGCNLAAAQCNIAYLIQPSAGVRNEAQANVLLRRIGASGMINDTHNVNLARAWNGRRSMASPLPVPNAVFITRVFPASQLAAALPQDGSRPLTGDWDLGTKMMTGVGTYSTNTFVFTKTVTEGDPCTNNVGYKSLAMGSNHYIQICTGDHWIHANEDITTIIDTTIHFTMPTCSHGVCTGGSSSSGDGGKPYWAGPDGQRYDKPNPGPDDKPCSDCSKYQGPINGADDSGAAAAAAAEAAAASEAAAGAAAAAASAEAAASEAASAEAAASESSESSESSGSSTSESSESSNG